MSGGETSGWPADPTDPSCPTCGEPVSATSSFCMHCQADLPSGGGRHSGAGRAAGTGEWSSDRTDADDGGLLGGLLQGWTTSEEEHDKTRPLDGEWSSDAAGATDADEDGGWFHPDSLLDDVSTTAVGLVGGLLIAVVTALLLAFPLGIGWGLLLGLVAWPVAGLWITYTRTVFGAVRKAGYLFAGVVALLPFSISTFVPGFAQEWVQSVFVFVVFTYPFGVVAAVLGFLAGLGRMDGGDRRFRNLLDRAGIGGSEE